MSTFHTLITSLRHKVKRLTITTPAAIIMGALILGASHIAYGFVAGNTSTSPVKMFLGKAVDATDHVEGNEKSKVVLLEYSDPECPYCVAFYPTLRQIRTEYADKIAFVYRHYPLTQIHPHAYDESRALACAGKIGGTKAFYNYMDSLYGYKSSNQTTQLTVNGKEDLAANTGLDRTAFNACMNDATSATEVDLDMEDGSKAGVQGTPATFVLLKTRKGYEIVATIDGARPYDYTKAAIEEALAR